MRHVVLASLALAACAGPASEPILVLPEPAAPLTHAVASDPSLRPGTGSRAAPSSARRQAPPAVVTCFDLGGDERRERIEAEWAPTGSRLAITCSSGIEVVDVPSRKLVGRRPARYSRGQFRADGAALLLLSSQGAEVWDLASDTLARLPGLPANASPTQLSTDFRRAVIPDSAGDLAVVDLASGATLATLRRARSLGATEVSWSPDSTMIATADTAVMLWDAATGKPLHGFPARPLESLDEHSLRWTANSGTLFFRSSVNASMSGEGRIRGLDVETATVRGPFSGSAFAVTRNGRTLFTSEPGIVWRFDLATRAQRPLYRETADGWHYTFGDLGVSADGRWFTGVMSMMSGVDFAAFDATNGSPAPWR